MKKRCVFLVVLLMFQYTIFSDIPIRDEQFIYSILAYSGIDYTGTFSGEDSDTIYILADTDNFLSARKTFVYYWPITGELKTDSSVLNQILPGTLKIEQQNENTQIVSLSAYTYFNIREEYETNWIVATGEQAIEAYQLFESLIDAYLLELDEFEHQKNLYNNTMTTLSQTVAALRKEGKDFSDLLEQAEALIPPEEPEYPDYYLSPPVQPQIGFRINLPEGEYFLRFISNDGNIMEGSERRIVSFMSQRDKSTGLEVIPGDKWTRPISSNSPSSTLYIDGSSDIYLRSFHQEDYNDLFYNKLIQNDAKGNPHLSKWVQIQQIPHTQISMASSNDSNLIINESPFFVEQIPGAALGYEIVQFDPEGKHKGQNPSLMAFHVPIESDTRVINIKVLDEGGTDLQGASRQIRVVKTSRAGFLALIFALLPLLVLLVVKFKRANSYL